MNGEAFATLGAGTTVRLEGNVFTGNKYGAEVDGPATIDMGGGPLSSAGSNTLSCNTTLDLFNATAVPANNNFWDHCPLRSGARAPPRTVRRVELVGVDGEHVQVVASLRNP